MIRYRIVFSSFLATVCICLTLWLSPAQFHGMEVRGDIVITQVTRRNRFIIVQFADLHFGEDESKDVMSKKVMRNVLSSEFQVDLAVFSGDQVSGYALENSMQELKKWAESLTLVSESQIPFATIFGNHDDQPHSVCPEVWFKVVKILLAMALTLWIVILYFPLTRKFGWAPCFVAVALAWMLYVTYPSTVMRRSLLNYEKAVLAPYSQTGVGASSLHGLSNFYLPVTYMNHTVLIFFLDSGGGRVEEKISSRQLNWVRSVSSRYPCSSSIAFSHIPSAEFEWVEAGKAGMQCFGNQITEPPCIADSDHPSPMSYLSSVGVRAVFVGHDHDNSWCCVPKDEAATLPALCYGRHTGYGGYGTLERGARVIELAFAGQSSEVTISTWLRLESGSKVDTAVLYPYSRPGVVVGHDKN
jgi:hypothetical protein